MAQPNQPIKRNPGNFSIHENKVRIQNLNGQSSVLFEDISSITWFNSSIGNLTLISIGIALLVFGPLTIISLGATYSTYHTHDNDSGLNILALLIALGSIGLIVYGYTNKTTWDDVIIETRGGALFSYSVDSGKGRIEVNRIEEAKRKATIG